MLMFWIVLLRIGSAFGASRNHLSVSIKNNLMHEGESFLWVKEIEKAEILSEVSRCCATEFLSPIVVFGPDIKIDEQNKILRLFCEASTFVFAHNFGTANAENEQEECLENLLLRVAWAAKHVTCPSIFIFSNQFEFFEELGKIGLKVRLLSYRTRLISMTQLNQSVISSLFTDSWLFSMMDTLFIIFTDKSQNGTQGLLYLPFTENGSRIVLLNLQDRKLSSDTGCIYQQKFTNFHGSLFNASAKPFPPYWNEHTTATGTSYSGTNYKLLLEISRVLNFRIGILNASDWDEVQSLVHNKSAQVAPVIHSVLPKRLQYIDFSYIFEFSFLGFLSAKPPSSQASFWGFVSALSPEGWSVVFAVVVIMPFPIRLAYFVSGKLRNTLNRSLGMIYYDVFATLLGQSSTDRLPETDGSRFLLAVWFLGAFLLGVTYTSKLTAELAVPTKASRIETLKELIKSGARVTMPLYGKSFQDFFLDSDSKDFRELGSRVDIIDTVFEGIQSAVTKRTAHLEPKKYMEWAIAQDFTEIDGNTKVYIAKESILPGHSAWPFPHDAPYQENFNKIMMHIIEAGLYGKWNEEEIRLEKMLSRIEHRRNLKNKNATISVNSETLPIYALTFVHIQGPFFLTGVGFLIAFLGFIIEECWKYFSTYTN